MKKRKVYHYLCKRCEQEFDTFVKDKKSCPYCRHKEWRTPKPESEKRGRPRKAPGSPTCAYVRHKGREISPAPGEEAPSPALPADGH